MNKRIIKVGVICDEMLKWGGGRGYLRNILNVLDALVVDDLSNEKYQLYVIFPKNYFDITDYTDVLSDEVIIVHSDDIADLVCNKLNLDVLFPILNKAVRNICIPYIQYIADMQEEHLPKFFDRFEISERRKINKYIAKSFKIHLCDF